MRLKPLLQVFVFFLFWIPSFIYAQPCALNIAPGANVSLSNGSFSYCSIDVSAGGTLVIGGAVTLNVAGSVNVDGLVTGKGNGYGSAYDYSYGPGAGTGSGGGGHGGSGDGWGGGPAYDSPTQPVFMGSQGGFTICASIALLGGAGGAALVVSAPGGSVTVNGVINMDGNDGPGQSVGGGAGGTISVDAMGIYGTGLLSADGGAGGLFTCGSDIQGGGGGGGLIRVCAINGVSFPGGHDVKGGHGLAGGFAGSPGRYAPSGNYYECTPTPTFTNTATATPTHTATPTPTFTPTPLTPTPPPGCVSTLHISTNLFSDLQEPCSITVNLCAPGESFLGVYNTAGERIKTLFWGNLPPSSPVVFPWNGTNEQGDRIASGVYIIRLTGPFEVRSGRVMLVR